MYNGYTILFEVKKNAWLKDMRAVCFDDIMPVLEEGGWLDIVYDHNPGKYQGQHMFILEHKREIYCVPYVADHARKELFLKTVYPNRKLRKLFIKEQ